MGMVIWPDLPWRAFEGSQPIMPMETGRLVETDRLEPSLAHTIDGTSTARLARFEQRVLQCGRAMPIPTFRLLSLQQPVGQGATGARYVGVQGVAKEHRAGSYTVVNEWVAAELARQLRLPIPPSFISLFGDTKYFVSMNFALSEEALPPVVAAAVVGAQPDLAARVTMFDAFIVNEDRHAQNMAMHPTTHELMIFDHSHCMCGQGAVGTARAFLEAHRGHLAIIGRHALVPELTSAADLCVAVARITDLPERVVREIALESRSFDVPPDEATFLADYLVARQHALMGMLAAERNGFPKVRQEELEACV